MSEVALFRYRERLHLTYEEAMNEPFEEVERAFLIWSLDDKRAKLEEARQNNK